MWLPKQPPWLPLPHPLLLPSFRRLLLKAPLLFSTSPATAPPRSPVETPGFVVEYLVSACGLSTAEATKASKYLSHLKSTAKPDAVLRLMREECLLDDSQIRRLVVCRPTVLTADPKKTLQPKIRSLLAAGFSGPELAQLVASSGIAMPLGSVLDRVQFWRNLLGSNQNILKAVDRNSQLLSLRLEEKVLPTLSFLRGVGVSDEKFGSILMRSPCLVTSNLDRLNALVDQVKSLGISPGSAIFVAALCNVSNVSRSTLEARMRFLKGFGWSQAELVLAFQRFPSVINISDKKIRAVMDFLLGEAGCSPSYVAGRPVLLGFSLERRLLPRFRVIQSLRAKGLPGRGRDRDLYSVMLLSDKKFVDKYIVPNTEVAPGLLEAYLVSGGKGVSR